MGWIAMATDQTSQSGHVCSIFVSFLFSDWRIWIEKREKREDFLSVFLESGQPSFFLILKNKRTDRTCPFFFSKHLEHTVVF